MLFLKKKNMKSIVFFLIAFISINLYSQPPNGRGRKHRNLTKSQILNKGKLKFEAKAAAGVFYYDVKKVIKKIKVKDSEIQKIVKTHLVDYNKKIKILSDKNSKNFSEIKLIIESIASIRDPKIKGKALTRVKELIKPIKKEASLLENGLNDNLKKILTKKQFKKWLKFQESKKEKNIPVIGVKRVLRYETQTKRVSNW